MIRWLGHWSFNYQTCSSTNHRFPGVAVKCFNCRCAIHSLIFTVISHSTTICKLVDLIPALHQSDCRILNWVIAKTLHSSSTNHGQTTARFRSFFRYYHNGRHERQNGKTATECNKQVREIENNLKGLNIEHLVVKLPPVYPHKDSARGKTERQQS